MSTVAPMVAAVVAGPAARLEVQGPLGGLTNHTPSKPCQLGARGGSCQVAHAQRGSSAHLGQSLGSARANHREEGIGGVGDG